MRYVVHVAGSLGLFGARQLRTAHEHRISAHGYVQVVGHFSEGMRHLTLAVRTGCHAVNVLNALLARQLSKVSRTRRCFTVAQLQATFLTLRQVLLLKRADTFNERRVPLIVVLLEGLEVRV